MERYKRSGSEIDRIDRALDEIKAVDAQLLVLRQEIDWAGRTIDAELTAEQNKRVDNIDYDKLAELERIKGEILNMSHALYDILGDTDKRASDLRTKWTEIIARISGENR